LEYQRNNFKQLSLVTSNECKENQVFDECTSPCTRTCEHISNRVPARVCMAVCKPACKCIKGYIINENGNCVPEKLCQPKGNYNTWNITS